MGVVGVDGEGRFGSRGVGEVAGVFVLRGAGGLWLLLFAGFTALLVRERVGNFGEFGGIGVGVVVVGAVGLAVETTHFGGFLVAVGADVVVVAVFILFLAAFVAPGFLLDDGGEVVAAVISASNDATSA